VAFDLFYVKVKMISVSLFNTRPACDNERSRRCPQVTENQSNGDKGQRKRGKYMTFEEPRGPEMDHPRSSLTDLGEEAHNKDNLSLSLKNLIPKHQELSSHIAPFRSLAIGKGARPEPSFKELPAPPFGP
jgi:hypothetical protein